MRGRRTGEFLRVCLLGTIVLGTVRLPEALASHFLTETADGSVNQVGLYLSLALDSQGNPHMSYVDNTTGDLKYARKGGGAWAIEVVQGTTSFATGWTSIELDASGDVHISLQDGSPSGLWYAKKSAGAWTLERADPRPGSGLTNSLELDSNGDPHIVYGDNFLANLRYASKVGGIWTVETADSTGNTMAMTALALDSSGNPHISSREGGVFDVRYVRKSGGAWIAEYVVSSPNFSGNYTSIAVDAQGNPHISYGDVTASDLVYATKSGGAWLLEAADSLNGLYTSIALDSQGNPRIAYSRPGGILTYASKQAGVWTRDAINAIGNGAEHASLVLASGDKPHIGYYIGTMGDAMYAYPNPTSVPAGLPSEALLYAYPNPAPLGEVRFRFGLADGERASLAILDVSGRRVRVLSVGPGAANGLVLWDGRDDGGRQVGSGHYVARLETSRGVESSAKITLLR
jgi:hypothetical protein